MALYGAVAGERPGLIALAGTVEATGFLQVDFKDKLTEITGCNVSFGDTMSASANYVTATFVGTVLTITVLDSAFAPSATPTNINWSVTGEAPR